MKKYFDSTVTLPLPKKTFWKFYGIYQLVKITTFKTILLKELIVISIPVTAMSSG